LTGLVYGRAGLRQFLYRLLKWRVAARWYAVALLTAPLLMMAVLLALSLFSREFVPGIFTSNDRATLLLVSIATAVGVGFFEELGWNGIRDPRTEAALRCDQYGTHCRRVVGRVALACVRLDRRHGFRGALLRWLPARCFPIPDALQGAHGVGVRRTASLLVAMFMHGSLTASARICAVRPRFGLGSTTWVIIVAVLLVVLAAMVIYFR
jgi:hypothetical protein